MILSFENRIIISIVRKSKGAKVEVFSLFWAEKQKKKGPVAIRSLQAPN